MKRVRITIGQIGLVFKNGEYQRILTAGKHWIGLFEAVDRYLLTTEFVPPVPLTILLRDAMLAEQLHVLEVKDHELVLLYIDGNFRRVLKPGRNAFWKGINEYRFETVNISENEVPANLEAISLKFPEIVPFVRVSRVEAFENGLLYVNNRLEKVLPPGEYHFWKNANEINVTKVDLRQRQLEVSGQEILTRDKASVRINCFAIYRVTDVNKAITDSKDFEKQLYLLLQLILREYVGQFTLDELLTNKEGISTYVLTEIAQKATEIGLLVSSCGLRDLILPGDMRDIMNQVLVAEKRAQANTIMRREETATTRSLLNTAKLMEENDMLMRLKEMEYLEKIADKISNISLSNGGLIVDQLNQLFVPKRK